MKKQRNIPELVAPAGNLEKLKVAFDYGADAAYLGGRNFGLRAAADNFNKEEILRASELAVKLDRKIYLTLNAMPHNGDIDNIREYLYFIKDSGVNAVIVSDPGVLALVKETAPDLNITLSTQANNVNYKSANFWHSAGVNRIVAARDISMDEVKETVEKTPDSLEIELFIHGAMCIAYSGRCLLSSYMTGREANTGECTQPCRWNYQLVEQERPGEYFPVIEENGMTTILSSKDLCLIKKIPDIVQSGVSALKIEGRMKSSYYAAVTVSAYRAALDAYAEHGKNYSFNPKWLEELNKVSHRDYTEAFYDDKPGSESQNYSDSNYIKNYEFLGLIKKYNSTDGLALVEQKNKIVKGDKVEIISPGKDYFSQHITVIYDSEGNITESAPHAGELIKIKVDEDVVENSIIRKKIDKE